MFRANNNEIVRIDGKANKIVVNLSKNNKFEKLMHIAKIGTTRKPIFLITNAKKIFNYLKQAFIKAAIFWHFNPKSYIWIKTDVLIML